MRYALRWWETLGKSERIVAMSLAAGSVISITSSTVWAVAASYMVKQRARVAIATSAAQHDEPPAPIGADTANGHLMSDATVRSVR